MADWPAATEAAFWASIVATTTVLPPASCTFAAPVTDCVRSPRVALASTWMAVGVAPAAGVSLALEPPQPAASGRERDESQDGEERRSSPAGVAHAAWSAGLGWVHRCASAAWEW